MAAQMMTSPSDRLRGAIEHAMAVKPSPDLQEEIDAALRWPVSDEVRVWRAEQDRIARGLGHANLADRERQRFEERELRRSEIEEFRKKNEQRAKNIF